MTEFVEVIKQKDRMCEYFQEYGGCKCCGISSLNNGVYEPCDVFCNRHPEETEKIIMDWVKEHPVVTRIDKVCEVLGVTKEELHYLKGCNGFSCSDIKRTWDYGQCNSKCKYYEFWEQEYKEPKEEGDE